MRECLSEDRLVAVYYGDAPDRDRDHRESCLACTRRYQQLTRDLDHITAALAGIPLEPVLERRRPVARWIITAVAAGLVCAVAWNVSRETPTTTTVVASSARAGIAEETEQVSEAVFDATDRDALRVTVRDRDEDYLRAAIDGGFPCLWYDPLYADDCNYTVAVGYMGG